MEEKKWNKNALRSRELLRNAYLKLLETKSSNQITISELVHTAGLNRATFYAHYSCLNDINEEIQGMMLGHIKKILEGFEFTTFFENPTQILLQLSLVLDENDEKIRMLLRCNELNVFYNKFYYFFLDFMEKDPSIPEKIKNSKSYRVRLSYFAGGIVNVYLKYFSGDLDCSIYDVPLIISGIIKADYDLNMKT